MNDELSVIRCAGIPELRFTARTPWWRRRRVRATVQLASAAVASGAADAVVVYRAFNERSGRRFGQPLAENNKARVTPPGWNWYLPFGLDTPAKVYALWYQRYMHTLRRHQRRLRPLPGRRPQARGDQPGRVLLPAADHARGPPGVALDRRADPAQARLLPGERRRRRAWSSPSMDRARDLPNRPVRVAAATPGPPPRRRGDVRLLRRRPRDVPGGGAHGSAALRGRPGSRPTTSTWR